MKGIILHGGFGTRLRPFTHTMPKQLLPIANKPMSLYGLEVLKNAGIKEIAIIIGGESSYKVRDFYGDGKEFGVNITYIFQESPKGISQAISLCEEFTQNEKFVVFLGDNILKQDISDIKNNFEKSKSDAAILLCEVENPSQFGIAEIDGESIKKIVEKPKNPLSNLAVIGVYFLTPKIYDIINRLKPSWRNELEITDALQMLLDENGTIKFEIVTGFWKDTGTAEDIIDANKSILEDLKSFSENINEENVTKDGVVVIGENSDLKDVIISGPVIIGKNCKIHDEVKIGPNVSIGDNCEISKVSITNSIIMSKCIINNTSKIKNSIIAHNSEIKSNCQEEQILFLGEDSKITS